LAPSPLLTLVTKKLMGCGAAPWRPPPCAGAAGVGCWADNTWKVEPAIRAVAIIACLMLAMSSSPRRAIIQSARPDGVISYATRRTALTHVDPHRRGARARLARAGRERAQSRLGRRPVDRPGGARADRRPSDRQGCRPGFSGRHERSRCLRLRLADAGANASHRRSDGTCDPRRRDAGRDPRRRVRHARPPLRRTVAGRGGHRGRLRRDPGLQAAARRRRSRRRPRQPGLRADRLRA